MTEQEILKQFNAPEGAILEKVFKNGNIKIKKKGVCSRCGNKNGIFFTHVCNGVPVPSHVDGGVCYRCNGSGWEWESEILMTPENKAKHDKEVEKKRKKQEEEQAKREAEIKAKEEAKAKARAEEEARREAERAISQHVGVAGLKYDEEVTYLYTAWFEVPVYMGYGTTTMHVHYFEDDKHNKLVWKTQNGLCEGIEKNMRVRLKGKIKKHDVYKNEKQTVMQRCTVTLVEKENKDEE